MPSWRTAHAKKQIAKKSKWALVALAVIFGIIIFGQSVKLTESFFKSAKSLHWNGDFNINVLVKAQGISLLSFSPKLQKITVIDIPDNTFLQVAKGFGKWEIRSVYNLGGEALLKNTLSNFFALPIDGWLNFSDKWSQKDSAQIMDEIRNPFSAVFILPYLKTDLSPIELLRLKMGIAKVRFDKIKRILLDEEQILKKNLLADGTQVLEADPVQLDSILAELADPNIQSEHLSIAVFNATDTVGLAQKATRLITNIGGDVIIIANARTKFKTTHVFGEQSKTLQRLKQIFGSGDTIDSNLEELVPSRAKINIFLGEDYLKKL